MSVMQEKYDGCVLTYNEYYNRWDVKEDGVDVGKSESLKGARAIVDRLHKEAKVFKRVEVYYMGYGVDTLRRATLTSVLPSTYGHGWSGWLSYDDDESGRRRSEESLDSLRLFTPENEALAKEAEKLDAMAQVFYKKAEALRGKMMGVIEFLKARGDLKVEPKP